MGNQQVREPKTKAENTTRPPLPPFTRETAIQKVRLAEDGWNSRDPEKVALAYPDFRNSPFFCPNFYLKPQAKPLI